MRIAPYIALAFTLYIGGCNVSEPASTNVGSTTDTIFVVDTSGGANLVELIKIPSINFMECSDSAITLNRNWPNFLTYYDADISLNKTLERQKQGTCFYKYNEVPDYFVAQVRSDYDLVSWDIRFPESYNILVSSGRITENAVKVFDRIALFEQDTVRYRYFQNLKSISAIFPESQAGITTYYDRTNKGFVIKGTRLWLGYIDIWVKKGD